MFGDQVHQDHDCIKAMRLGQLTNEVYAYSLPSSLQQLDRIELADGFSTNDLVLNAFVTQPSVEPNMPSYLGPPVVSGNEL